MPSIEKLKPAYRSAQIKLRDDIHINGARVTVCLSKDWIETIDLRPVLERVPIVLQCSLGLKKYQ